MTNMLRRAVPNIREPRARKNQTCVVCGNKKTMPPNDPKGIYRVDLDPFCSTRCCKQYYGVEKLI
jgi:hypothetical protein